MTDPRNFLGPEDGIVANDQGKTVGFFWENPITKGMTDNERAAYWEARKKREQFATQ